MIPRELILRTATASLLIVAPNAAMAADHLDAPNLRTAGQGDRDINDLYAFQSPVDANNSVLILTVNPFAGVMNPFGTTSPTTFGTDVDYQFEIDNDGDAVPDVVFSTMFSAAVGGTQAYTITRNGSPFAGGTTGGISAISTGGNSTAGLFDDPFFFDLVGFNDGFNFTGTDTFAGASVSAIVLEVPSTDLTAAGPNVGVTARTVVGGNQIDRMGRPAINTVLIPTARKDEFNMADEANDFAAFSADAGAVITSLSDAANAAALTPILLPDVLTFDTSDPAGFLNGRGLSNDVIDAELNLLSAGAVTSDGVNANDVPFRSVFPYLAPVPEPATGLFALAGVTTLLRRRRLA